MFPGDFVKTENYLPLRIKHSSKIQGLLVFDGSGFAMATEVRCYLLPAIIGLCGVTDGQGKAAN